MMTHPSNTPNIQAIIRAFIKLIITFALLYVIRTALLALPGNDVLIPNIPVTFSVAANALLGILMIFVMLRFNREVIPPMENSSISPTLISIVLNLDYILALGLAYISFLPLVDALQPSYVWGYSMILFLISLYPLSKISLTIYRSIDQLTLLISEKLVKPRRETEEVVSCPVCGFGNDLNSVFCTKCGTKIKENK
jgi:hypothetical protein